MKESDIQKSIVKYVRAQYPEIQIYVNPFSEMTFSGMTEAKKRVVIMNAKAAGWESSVADLTFVTPKGVIGMELKTPRENPFRISKGGYWIETNRSRSFPDMPTKKGKHVWAQALHLSKVCKLGGLGLFCTSFDDAKKIIDRYMTGEQLIQLEEYRFSYGWESECKIYKTLDK